MSLELSAASSPELVKDAGNTGEATGQQQVKLEAELELPLASAQPQPAAPQPEKGQFSPKSAHVFGEASGLAKGAIFPTFRANIKGAEIGSTSSSPDTVHYDDPCENRSVAQSGQKD